MKNECYVDCYVSFKYSKCYVDYRVIGLYFKN